MIHNFNENYTRYIFIRIYFCIAETRTIVHYLHVSIFLFICLIIEEVTTTNATKIKQSNGISNMQLVLNGHAKG